MKVENKGSRRVPLDRAASYDEITATIDGLTPRQAKQLEIFAKWRVGQLGETNLDGDWQDLIQQALTSLLVGDRRWNKDNVDLVKFLTEAMRSISNNWFRINADNKTDLESDLITTHSDGHESNPLLQVTAPNLDGRSEQKAKQDLAHIETLVAQRETAALIIMASKDGMNGPEIQAELGISQTAYETEMKWIRRAIRPEFGKEK